MKLVYIFLFLSISRISSAQTIVIADEVYGWNATDASDYFYAAINGERGTGNTLVFRNMGSPWYITYQKRMFDVNDLTIIFEEGCVIEAKEGSWTSNQKLLFILRATKLHLIGYGAKFVMHKSDFPAGEYGHSISITSLNDSSIKGLELDSSGGDGLYIDNWTNVLVEDVYAHDHKRQGATITNADGVTIRSCRFDDTGGTAPQDGIDIEPDRPEHYIKNILIENCSFVGNNSSGLRVVANFLDSTSEPIGVTVRDCYFYNNNRSPSYVARVISGSASGNGDPFDPVGSGTVLFERCALDGEPARMLYTNKKANDYLLKYKNVVVFDSPNSQGPVYLEADYGQSTVLGGIEFENVFFKYDNDYEAIRFQSDATTGGLKDITGNILIQNPYTGANAIKYTGGTYNGSGNDNVTVTMERQTTLPATEINVIATIPQAIKGQQEGVVTFTRESNRIDYPLFVKYSITAPEVKLRNEVMYLPGSVVIPAGQTSAQIKIKPRLNGKEQPVRTLTLNIEPRSIYTIGSGTASIKLTDRQFRRLRPSQLRLNGKQSGVQLGPDKIN